MRTCVICGRRHKNRSGMRNKDGDFYYTRKCYQCGLSNKGRRTKEDRFLEYCGQSDGCWEWQKGLDNKGYGLFAIGTNKSIGAHRYSYELHNGLIPDGMYVCHKCDNTRCVNPEHLFLGTHQDNMSDMVTKGRSTIGSRNPKAKLTENDVIEIRRLLSTNTPFPVLMKKFNISERTLYSIRKRDTWRHVK